MTPNGKISWDSLDLSEGLIDQDRMNEFRLGRLQAELRRKDIDAILLYDPANIRYATGIRNMQVWAFHSLVRLAFVPAQGKVVAFEYAGSEHLASDLVTVAEVRPSIPFHFGPGLSAGQVSDKSRRWVQEVEAVARQYCGNGRRLALDNQVPHAAGAVLAENGFDIVGGYDVVAVAQSVKNADEVRAMKRSIEVAELGIAQIREKMTPGVTENQLWAELNYVNIACNGEYMDTRLLSSGPRTNPWYQECGERQICAGDMIALDTDMIGPYGYDADISRSFVCDEERATPRQKEIYRIAYDHIHHNMDLLRQGRTFRELSELAFKVPEPYRAQTIAMNWHGVSLYGGWPTILGHGLFDETSEDGDVVPGMTLCVEAYVGEVGGPDGVKLEEQVLVTETGYRLLSSFPFEEHLLRSSS